MRRLIKVGLITLAACFAVLLAAWGISRLYQQRVANLQRISELESTVAELKRVAHPQWRIRQGHSFRISTSDRPASEGLFDYRLVFGTNTAQTFEGAIWKELGTTQAAWFSDWEPRAEMDKFEQLKVEPARSGPGFKIIAKAKPGESIDMKFTVTFIVE